MSPMHIKTALDGRRLAIRRSGQGSKATWYVVELPSDFDPRGPMPEGGAWYPSRAEAVRARDEMLGLAPPASTEP